MIDLKGIKSKYQKKWLSDVEGRIKEFYRIMSRLKPKRAWFCAVCHMMSNGWLDPNRTWNQKWWHRFLQNRRTGDKVIAVVGAAQIDMYGNLNTTCIGWLFKAGYPFCRHWRRLRCCQFRTPLHCIYATRKAKVCPKTGLFDKPRSAFWQGKPRESGPP